MQDGTSKSAETDSTDEINDKLRSSSGLVLYRKDENGDQSENNKLSEIEQMVKRNKFSRYKLIDVAIFIYVGWINHILDLIHF